MTVTLTHIQEWAFGLCGTAVFSDGKNYEFWGYGDKANTPRFHYVQIATANRHKLPRLNRRNALVQDALNAMDGNRLSEPPDEEILFEQRLDG